MPFTTNGLTQVTFGIPATLTGYVIQDVSLSKKPGVTVEIYNESGHRKHVRYDDETTEGSINAYFNGGTAPTVGGVLTFNGVKYEVTSVDIAWNNKDCTKYSIKLKNSENLTLV